MPNLLGTAPNQVPTNADLGTMAFQDAGNYLDKTAGSGFGFKNRIINGAMMIDQRNSGAAVTLTTSSQNYIADRWAANRGTSNTATAQTSSTAPSGYVNSLLYTVGTGSAPAASDYATIAQRVEGLNIADLGWGAAGAASVTLSFWVRSSLTGTFGINLTNGAQTLAYATTYTISAANTWEYKSVTVPGPTSATWLTTNGVGIQLNFDMGVGSTQSVAPSSSWQSGNYLGVSGVTKPLATPGATFYITGVQLEKGSTATSFDYRPYGTELALCQRYFEKTYPTASAVGSVGGAGYFYENVVLDGGGNYAITNQFVVPKRASPTIVMYNQNTGNSASWSYSNSGGGSGNFTPNIDLVDESSFRTWAQVGGTWALASVYGHWTVSAEL